MIYAIGLLAALAGNADSMIQLCRYEYDSIADMRVFTYVTQKPVPGVSFRDVLLEGLLPVTGGDIQGYVRLEWIVDTFGQSLYPRISRKTPDAYTDLERQIVARVRFLDCWEPAACNGIRVPYRIVIPLHIGWSG